MSNDLPNDCEQDDLIVGQTIVKVRPTTEVEMKIECLAWRDSCQAFPLKSGVDPDLALPSGLAGSRGRRLPQLRSTCLVQPIPVHARQLIP
ncbi:hypothetical protein COB72_05630 [bacterium]|nr:MAG: hypothetical protein COB72_05630 [bacterium]